MPLSVSNSESLPIGALYQWSLDCRVNNLLFDIWGLPTVDLFTTRLNNKVETFFSRLPGPLALQGNPLHVAWSEGLLYMYPPLPPPPPVPCSSQGDQNGDSGHSDSTMVAAKRVVSLGRGLLGLQLLVDLPVMLPGRNSLLLAPDRTKFLVLRRYERSCCHHMCSS